MKGNLLRLLLFSDILRILNEDEAFFRNICGKYINDKTIEK